MVGKAVEAGFGSQAGDTRSVLGILSEANTSIWLKQLHGLIGLQENAKVQGLESQGYVHWSLECTPGTSSKNGAAYGRNDLNRRVFTEFADATLSWPGGDQLRVQPPASSPFQPPSVVHTLLRHFLCPFSRRQDRQAKPRNRFAYEPSAWTAEDL